MSRCQRRDFIKAIGAGAAGAGIVLGFPTIVPAAALGKDGKVAPGNRIVMGSIGVGGMGTGDLKGFLGKDAVQVVAVCDVDRDHREKAKKTVDAKYGNNGCKAYLDFREMIGRGDLDAVATALPDHWHAIPAIAAARAGLDVFGQKPLARSIREGRAMCDAVQRHAVVWQTGSQQRSDARFRFACELVRNGRIGKVSHAEVGLPGSRGSDILPQLPVPEALDWNFWLGPAPWRPYAEFGGKGGRCHFNWRRIMDYSGGGLTDWAGHHIDIAHWGLGLERAGPIAIEGKGEYPSEGTFNTPTKYDFTLTYASGVKIRVSNSLTMGAKWYGDKGWIWVTRGRMDAEPKKLLKEVIGPEEIHLYKSTDHKGNFLECIRTRRETVAPIEIGHRSISAGLLGEIAMLTGRKIRWNPDTEEIIGDPGASALLGRSYREPWVL